MLSLNDTISAIATPRGVAALGIIRVDGEDALEIVQSIFKPISSTGWQPRTALVGTIQAPSGRVLDQAVATFFKAPHSYTGNNLIELSCHGSPVVLDEVLALLIEGGARLAEPGEFTRRAFLNGKMDLLQAESVADIIHSQTQRALRQSQEQLQGALSEKLTELQAALKHQAALLEVELDFSEEDVEFASRDQLLQNIDATLTETRQLLETFRYGRLMRDGAHIVIAGKPNVGKSSILNRLLLQDRALVSDIPGTTRDSIEESLNIRGYLFKITDTAGLRQAADAVETMGVERSLNLLKKADIVLMVQDAREGDSEFDIQLETHQHGIVLVNKSDLVASLQIPENMPYPAIALSAKTGEGFPVLEEALVDIIKASKPGTEAPITKVRHRNALQKTLDHLQHARSSLHQNLSGEFIAMDLRVALDALGELTGETTTDDILNDIFSRFCIGK